MSSTVAAAEATPSVRVHRNLYGYDPTLSVCVIFVVLFTVSTVLHIWQAARSKAWWLVPTVIIAGVAEVGGWVARTVSSNDPTSLVPFIIQAIVLVLAPTPLVAALFMGFGRVTDRLGAEYSRLSPRMYSRIFLTCDLVALNIQGGGGGLTANPKLPASTVQIGSNIVLAGLIFQIIAMSVFMHLMGEYVWRWLADRPYRKPEVQTTGFAEGVPRVMTREMKLLMTGICTSTVLVYLRSVYRVVEFANGSNGPIVHNQVLFNVFDGAMITLGMFVLNFMHPGMLLQSTATDSGGYMLTERASRQAGN